MEDLKSYFENTRGMGVLSTADAGGRVDAAIYARPHMVDGNALFIMRARLTRANVLENPHAVYLFVEEGPGYRGKRLFLTWMGEEKDLEKIQALRRSSEKSRSRKNADGDVFLATFRIDRVLPLVGPGEE